ncbi:hypothetical protein [Roseiconus lacunae]|uniref:hypothetical protein n=1 Tax=Roseiconus lacunae TaxID=2605694 RepID=UPI001E5F59B1|nr:hypothetical protein [Roseiconus lacunae]MCD0458606.1 hypothetical protein [Roseiconus lacunae]
MSNSEINSRSIDVDFTAEDIVEIVGQVVADELPEPSEGESVEEYFEKYKEYLHMGDPLAPCLIELAGDGPELFFRRLEGLITAIKKVLDIATDRVHEIEEEEREATRSRQQMIRGLLDKLTREAAAASSRPCNSPNGDAE